MLFILQTKLCNSVKGYLAVDHLLHGSEEVARGHLQQSREMEQGRHLRRNKQKHPRPARYQVICWGGGQVALSQNDAGGGDAETVTLSSTLGGVALT